MDSDPYLIPGTNTLKNNLNITDAKVLDEKERLLVTNRLSRGCPKGKFDLKHLQAIHKHLFQDIYPWAGEIRHVEIDKGGEPFQTSQFIGRGMEDVHRRLTRRNFLKGLSKEQFATEVGNIISDVNFVHPFREGNGRTQLEYLRQLAKQAGHYLNPDNLDRDTWQKASHEGRVGSNGPIINAILTQAMAPKKAPLTPKEPIVQTQNTSFEIFNQDTSRSKDHLNTMAPHELDKYNIVQLNPKVLDEISSLNPQAPIYAALSMPKKEFFVIAHNGKNWISFEKTSSGTAHQTHADLRTAITTSADRIGYTSDFIESSKNPPKWISPAQNLTKKQVEEFYELTKSSNDISVPQSRYEWNVTMKAISHSDIIVKSLKLTLTEEATKRTIITPPMGTKDIPERSNKIDEEFAHLQMIRNASVASHGR